MWSATPRPACSPSLRDCAGWGSSWDEEYRQSERLALHRRQAEAIFARGHAYRDFTPAHAGEDNSRPRKAHGSAIPECANCHGKRATAAPPRASRSLCAIACRAVEGRTAAICRWRLRRAAEAADEVEDFALLRSDGMPTYHLASCVDDADLRISHIIRGQDHLTNTFKHLLIFEGLGVEAPQFAHLPLLVAPDGTKLSKRKHGPVVSVTTYRDAGFLPQAFINFLCLLGWSPKNDREFLTLRRVDGPLSRSRASTGPMPSSISRRKILLIPRPSG